jgi:Protein of unknown function (DUF3102)
MPTLPRELPKLAARPCQVLLPGLPDGRLPRSPRHEAVQAGDAGGGVVSAALALSLPDLAARIRAEHEGAEVAWQRALVHAMAAGELLIEAKAQVKHGQWLPWLAEHCGIKERTAQVYMRMAKNREEIEAKSAGSADMTIEGAIKLLAGPAKASTPIEACDQVMAEMDAMDAAIDASESERAKRKALFGETNEALEAARAGGCAFTRYDDFMAAIAECKKALEADLDVPFSLSTDATSALVQARDIVTKMLLEAEAASSKTPTWYTDTKYRVMPPLTADEYESLKEDIRRRGMMVAVEYDEEGHILDGHHRVKACEELGITEWPRIVRLGLTEDGKRFHARKINMLRKHLSEDEQAVVMANIATLKQRITEKESAA